MAELCKVGTHPQRIHELAHGSPWRTRRIELHVSKLSDAGGRSYGFKAILIIAGVHYANKLNKKRIELNSIVPAIGTHK